MWVCVHCLEVTEDEQWDECWNCGAKRDCSEAAAGKVQEKTREIELLREQFSRCTRCQGSMKFHGYREIPYDLSIAWGGHLGRGAYEVEKFALYHCTRCGKVELFLAEVGADLRGDPS